MLKIDQEILNYYLLYFVEKDLNHPRFYDKSQVLELLIQYIGFLSLK